MIESQHVCFSKQNHVSYRKEIKTPLQRDFQISLPPARRRKQSLQIGNSNDQFQLCLKKSSLLKKKIDFFIITLTNTTIKVDVLQKTLQTVAKNVSMKSSLTSARNLGKFRRETTKNLEKCCMLCQMKNASNYKLSWLSIGKPCGRSWV